ncbi:MAG: PQQ-binding-like beta-propeller repeat protein [Acidobacteria bacterium]|nr:PQQ-binding-like beta-propeller repeat protein [Acidobacteriota bacterium]
MTGETMSRGTSTAPWLAMGLMLFGITACGGASQSPAPGSAGPSAAAQPDEAVGAVTDAMLQDGHRARPSTWPTYGGDWGQTRYSPLTEIRRENVTRLRPAWIAQTGVVGSFESTPIVLGHEMYVTTPGESGVQRVIRLDSATGEVVWQVTIAGEAASEQAATEDLHLPTHFGPNRGVAVYGDRVYTGTLNGRLRALERSTGRTVFEVKTLSPRLTGAPVAVQGHIIEGLSFVDRGAVQAFDADTGALAWTWYAIPAPEDGGWWGEWIETLPGRPEISLDRDIPWEKANQARLADGWKTGGASAPMTPTVDAERGLAYVSTGGPDPTAFPPPSEPHPGDMRWTNSVCAIRIADGTTAWCYQFLPHDIWGASGPTPPIRFALERDGRVQQVVGKFTGMGNLYVLDADTGALVTRSDNYMPVEGTVGGAAGSNLIRGGVAGTIWSPGAYSVQTGLLYSVNQRIEGYFLPRDEARGKERFGNVAAVSPQTGKVIWTHKTDQPLAGGVLATAGGLVFAGRTSGWFDAYDAATGDRLWSFRTGAGCNSAPMTYQVAGRQYVALSCGGHGSLDPQGGDTVVAFALPE